MVHWTKVGFHHHFVGGALHRLLCHGHRVGLDADGLWLITKLLPSTVIKHVPD
ncbi:MAG: hypothetical protein IPO94_06795 [Saprospiraceae bacterium]|nr:hypothetical protein [Saprospiraceae bacterium]